MANIKSQIKRIRTNEAARLRNKSVKSALKTAVRRVRTAVDAGDKQPRRSQLVVASRSLDKAVSKGVIHPNQAANRKSALAQQVNSSEHRPAASNVRVRPTPVAPGRRSAVTGAACASVDRRARVPSRRSSGPARPRRHQVHHRLFQGVVGVGGRRP